MFVFFIRFWNVVIQRVAVIKLRVNNRCGNGTGSFEVKIGGGYNEVHECDNNKI